MRERLFRVGLIVALVVAAGSLYLAFATGRDEEAPVRRGAIVRVFPMPNTVALRQDAIGADLAFGYTAVISIDSRRIPEDQVDVVQGINRWSFTPGSGKEIETLPEGRHCASIAYVASSADAAATNAARTYSWCFTSA